VTPIDYKAWGFWFGVGQFIFNAAVLLYVTIANRQKANAARVAEAEKRLAQLESDVKHPPSCTYHPRLEERMDKAIGKIERMDGKLDGLNRAVDVMNEFLINQGGK
jgi:predicted nuclease with TOPRIM domain